MLLISVEVRFSDNCVQLTIINAAIMYTIIVTAKYNIINYSYRTHNRINLTVQFIIKRKFRDWICAYFRHNEFAKI